MPLDPQAVSTVVVVLAVAVVVLAVWVAWLQRSDALLRRRLRRLIGEGEGVGLDELLDRQFRRLDTVAERVEALNRLHHELEALSRQSLQKVGVIRFNPFADTGGDQSFAVALLDAAGNGVVLSSLHGRADTRIFAKPVQAGRSKHALSDEEQDAIRKALSMGADKAIHVSDEALKGSDLIATAKVLAAAIGRVEGYDLVIAGNEASDGRGGAVPAAVAELLGLPQLTHLREVTVDGGTVKGVRETDDGRTRLEASLPALVSVTEKINEPRYPSFKGIMAAKKKPVETLTIADLGIDAGEVGLGNAWSAVVEASPKPPRQAGQRVEDEGDGGAKVAEYLVGQKLI